METTIKEELAIVKRLSDRKYNYITEDGKLLFEKWFVWASNFCDGLARVQRADDTMNFLNKDGKIISDEWFKYVDYFDKDGLAVVERTNGEQCKIDKNGKIVVCK